MLPGTESSHAIDEETDEVIGALGVAAGASRASREAT